MLQARYLAMDGKWKSSRTQSKGRLPQAKGASFLSRPFVQSRR
jgi:hypothetical protein